MSSKAKKIYFVTGGKGSGKTWALGRFAKPSQLDKVVFFDTEDSANDLLDENARLGVSFGHYSRAYERLGTSEERESMLSRIADGDLPWVSNKQKSALVDYWQWFVQELNDVLVPGKYEYLCIDTIEPIEAAAAAWSEVKKVQSGWSGISAYGRLEIEAVRPLLDNTFEAASARGIEYILISSHIKNPWVEYAPGKSRPVLDRVKPGGRLKLWSQLAQVMLWMVPMRPPNQWGRPSALILKARKGHDEIVGDEWQPRRVMPPRIPEFTWANFRNYEQNGYNPIHPKEGELLYPDESEMISEFISDKQMELMTLGAQIALEEERRNIPNFQKETPTDVNETLSLDSNLPPDLVSRIKQMSDSGKSTSEIATSFNLTIPQVIRVLK